MSETDRLHEATNSVSAIVVSLDLMERVLARLRLGSAERAEVDACLREMNESVTLLRTLITRDRACEGEETK